MEYLRISWKLLMKNMVNNHHLNFRVQSLYPVRPSVGKIFHLLNHPTYQKYGFNLITSYYNI